MYINIIGRIDAHHHAKISRNWSIQSRHIAIFQIFKMAAANINDKNCSLSIMLTAMDKNCKNHKKVILHSIT